MKLVLMLLLRRHSAAVLKRAAATTPQAFERATGLRVLHMSPAVVVVDKPTGLRSVPAYGPTRALLAEYARRKDAGEADLEEKFERPTRRDRWNGVARDLDGLAPELRKRWDSLPRTKSKFVKFCGGPAGGRLNTNEAEDAWQLLRDAVAQRELDEGMEESDSVLRRVQREAGFPEACPVHRLDYATSGCLAVALTHAGASDLSLQWRERKVDKTYEAVVSGVVAADEGLIDWALLRIDAEHRSGDPSRVECVDDDVPGAKLSRSSYKVLERTDTTTRLDLIPHTGRLHQLRAHCKSLGHPIVGDWLYGEVLTQRESELQLEAVAATASRRCHARESRGSFTTASFRAGRREPFVPSRLAPRVR